MFWCALQFFFCVLFEKMDQRNCLKYCLKNEIKCAKTFEMLTVMFGESTMSRTQVQLWYNQFKEGPEDFKDDAGVLQQRMKTLKQ